MKSAYRSGWTDPVDTSSENRRRYNWRKQAVTPISFGPVATEGDFGVIVMFRQLTRVLTPELEPNEITDEGVHSGVVSKLDEKGTLHLND